MKITIDIRSEGGPIDASVALAKRAARKVRAQIRVLRRRIKRAARKVRAQIRVLRRRIRRALKVPPPVLLSPGLKPNEIAAG